MTRAALVIVLGLAGGCPGKPAAPGGGGGGGGGSGAAGCEGLRPRLEQLYRADAEANEPKRVDEAVADNTAMVLGDCAKAPDRVIPCVHAATSVAEIEQRCVIPLDEEGSEGLELMR